MDSQHRATFASRYALPRSQITGVRLMDLCRCTAQGGDGCYRDAPGKGEFKVLDKVTKAVGFFDHPDWIDAGRVQQLIEGHFGASAYELNHGTWIV